MFATPKSMISERGDLAPAHAKQNYNINPLAKYLTHVKINSALGDYN